MTVTFKPPIQKPPSETMINPTVSLDFVDFEKQYEEIKKHSLTQVKKQSDAGCYFRLYLTHSEQKPLKWDWYDSSVYIKEKEQETFLGYLKNIKIVKKDCGATGFKIVCIGLDALNLNNPPTFVTEWCREEWAPTQKTYVNGPKKTPFPKKAAGHF